MKKLLIALLLIPTLSLAESGVKIHGLNLGYGSEGNTATGLGVAYNSLYIDRYMLPNQQYTTTFSYSVSQQFAALRFGSYIGVSEKHNSYVSGYNLGTEYNLYFQPYMRFYEGVELSVFKGGSKLSFIILAR